MTDDLKQRSTISSSGKEDRHDATLLQLMEEMIAAKQAVQDVLKISPEDIQLHRIHGMYTGHILDIRKTILQEQAVDRDQLLIVALRGMVKFLLHKGEAESAQIIGDNLEEIGNEVKLLWQDTKVFQNWPTVTMTSEHSSPAPSPRSAQPQQSKKKNAKSAR